MVSFVRLQDCERLAAFINSDGTAKPGLLEVIFRDLAAVHGVDVDYVKNYYEDKEENFFAWDWTQDPSAVGWCLLPVAALTLFNRCCRICILWPRRVWGWRPLRCTPRACGWRKTFHRRRGGQCSSWVRGFTVNPLDVVFIPIRSIVGSPALWIAHGVPFGNTSPSIAPTSFTIFTGCGEELSTGARTLTIVWWSRTIPS